MATECPGPVLIPERGALGKPTPFVEGNRRRSARRGPPRLPGVASKVVIIDLQREGAPLVDLLQAGPALRLLPE